MSCDLLPSDVPGPHYVGDIRDLLESGQTWDALIGFPPCTYLCSSGLHWNTRRPERAAMTEAGLAFVRYLMDTRAARFVAIENPVGCISSRIRKPDQIIQPWQFGHPESKTTCLWLRGLPLLAPTNVLEPEWLVNPDGSTVDVKQEPLFGDARRAQRARWQNQTASGQNRLPPSADRWKIRSKTYAGIAAAMADQWGSALVRANVGEP